MTLLFLLENHYPLIGGVETLFKHLTDRLAAEGHEVVVVTSLPDRSLPRREVVNGVTIVRVPVWNRYLFTFAAFFAMLPWARRCDLVHTTSYNAGLPAFLGARLFGKPVVITFHEAWGRLWFELPFMGRLARWGHYLFEQLLLRLPFDRFVAVSESTAAALRREGVAPERVRVIYNGLDYLEFGVGNAELGGRNAELGIRNAELGVRNAEVEPEGRNPVPEGSGSEFGVGNAELGGRNEELGVGKLSPQGEIPYPQDQDGKAEGRNSEFPIPHSELRIPNSDLPIPNSELRIPNSQFRTPNSHFTYTYFGRLGISKGLDLLLPAARLVKERLPESRLQLIVPREPASFLRWIHDYLRAHGLEDYVLLRHALPFAGLQAALRASDCVVVPSYSEGFCFAAAETIALGTPLVHSGRGALPEVVSGKFIEMAALTPEALAAAILDGARGRWRETPVRFFRLEETVAGYWRLYGEMGGGFSG